MIEKDILISASGPHTHTELQYSFEDDVYLALFEIPSRFAVGVGMLQR